MHCLFQTQNAALLWDLQNAICRKKQSVCVPKIMQWIDQKFNLVDGAVAHNWQNGPIQDAFNQFPSIFQLQASTDQPNRADNSLINYAMRHILPNLKIKVVVLISSDGDFILLVKKLQAAGKQVWVIYKNSLNKKLEKVADRCFSLDEIINPGSTATLTQVSPNTQAKSKAKATTQASIKTKGQSTISAQTQNQPQPPANPAITKRRKCHSKKKEASLATCSR